MNHPAHEHSNSDHAHDRHDPKHPYWKRAHHDWKFRIAVCLMLIGMVVYVLTLDLSIQPAQPQSPESKQAAPS
ncbi:hypothetical protein [Schlesneria paludicola]|uniref:hypothetical protein n=1 Tax=Schlesneria paludicola TaxID=360056 RepID=UPI00029A4D8B|nr:hypothetical protein [Schlesneria paludicola]